jgi:hypothetical protein
LAGCAGQSAHRRFRLALRAGAGRDRGWRGGPSAVVGEQGKAPSWSPARASGSAPTWSTSGIVGRRAPQSRIEEDVAEVGRTSPCQSGSDGGRRRQRRGRGVETASSNTAPPRTHHPLLPRRRDGGAASSSRADLCRRRGRAGGSAALSPASVATVPRAVRPQVRLRCRNPATTASSPHREHRREEGRESGQRPGGDRARHPGL